MGSSKYTSKSPESRTFAGHIALKLFTMGNFTKFLPSKPFVQIQLFHLENLKIVPTHGRKASSYLCIGKKWLQTMALTQPLAVEPLRWGLRGVAAQCFVVRIFF
jgi:hypothetical protein